MSARATALVWARFPEGGGALLLALALADQSTDAGEYIAIDIDRLSKKTRLSDRTVREQLRSMADAGWLEPMDGSKAYRIAATWMGGAAPAAAPEKAAKAIAKRAARLSKDWALPDDWKTWALAEYPAWTPEWVASVAARFKDHWLSASGQTASKVEWDGTWRNWCRKEPAVPPVAAAAPQAGQWWNSSAAIERKGAELDVVRIDGETWPQWRDRIFRAAGDGPWLKLVYKAPDPTGGGFVNVAGEIAKMKGIVGGPHSKV